MVKEFWRRMREDPRYRNRWTLGFSVVFNVTFIVSQFFDSIWTGTFWASAIGIYYTAIIVAKMVLLGGMGQKSTPERERRVVQATGYILLVLYVLLGGSTVQLVADNPEVAHSQMGAAIAVAYTLYRVISAVVSVHWYRKKSDLVLTAVKIVNLMAAIVAIVMSQTTITMLVTNDAAILQWITGVVGILSSVGIVAASAVLIRMGRKGLKG